VPLRVGSFRNSRFTYTKLTQSLVFPDFEMIFRPLKKAADRFWRSRLSKSRPVCAWRWGHTTTTVQKGTGSWRMGEFHASEKMRPLTCNGGAAQTVSRISR
jgi:hypothetical protein